MYLASMLVWNKARYDDQTAEGFLADGPKMLKVVIFFPLRGLGMTITPFSSWSR